MRLSAFHGLSPALYLPDAIFWNCWMVTLTLEKSMGVGASFRLWGCYAMSFRIGNEGPL